MELTVEAASTRVLTVERGVLCGSRDDGLAVEEPLEIRLGFQAPEGWVTRSLSITMRTPGHDCELAAGFLLSEGIVRQAGDIAAVRNAGLSEAGVVRVDLAPGVSFDPARLQRHFYVTSSCGVCGKASLEALSCAGYEPFPSGPFRIAAQTIHALPGRLLQAQPVFGRTGGLHAAALFGSSGDLLALREDVGRHNALDKLIGGLFLQERTPLADCLLLLSGRTSFELVQKAAAAGIPAIASVGAPSSLAVDLARDLDLTLAGFVRDGRFNIYSGEWRIVYETAHETR